MNSSGSTEELLLLPGLLSVLIFCGLEGDSDFTFVLPTGDFSKESGNNCTSPLLPDVEGFCSKVKLNGDFSLRRGDWGCDGEARFLT
jgi:hypothetical protein